MDRQELVHNFIENVEKNRISMGLTQQQMAQKLGMSVSGYKKMILGQTSKIDLYVAHRMYALTGKMLFELCDDPIPALPRINKYRSLTPRQQDFIRGIIDFEYAFKEENKLPDEFISVYVPIGNVKDGMIWDSANIEKVNAAPYIKRFGAALNCGIKVTSNHLHPAYHQGDILLINRQPPRDGDVGIFINTESGRVYIRKFRQTDPCRLEPINYYGVPIEVDSNDEAAMDKWIKFGRVLTKMRT